MFRVEWLDRAFDQMDTLIRSNPDLHSRFTTALQRLSRDLSQWPEEVGESRPKGRRIAFFSPLVVYYRVRQAESIVRVISIHLQPGVPPGS